MSESNWRKSSYSGDGGSNCVEVGSGPTRVLVRDTKNEGRGPVLSVSPETWRNFTAGIKHGR